MLTRSAARQVHRRTCDMTADRRLGLRVSEVSLGAFVTGPALPATLFVTQQYPFRSALNPVIIASGCDESIMVAAMGGRHTADIITRGTFLRDGHSQRRRPPPGKRGLQ